MKSGSTKKIGKAARILWNLMVVLFICFSAALVMVCKWAKETFNVGLNAIINTLCSPLKGTSSTTVIPAVTYCLPVVLFVFIGCLIYLVFEKKYNNRFLRGLAGLVGVVSVVAAFTYVQTSYDVIGYIATRNQDTNFYKEYYIAPTEVKIEEPENKRNLIYIYLESMETTYADEASGGKQEVNYMPYATQLAKENISFSNTDKLGGLCAVNGATWTMGALFTSSSALPFAIPIGENEMEGKSAFASGTYTLGNFLEEQGYKQEFLCGSDAVFAGRRTFYEQHGNYEIFDLYTARERGYIAEDYFEWWGVEDKILYEIAQNELLRLSDNEEPFNFTMLTVDAHHIGGYTCELCKTEYEDVTANVIACADRQLQEFINWCKEQEFYENTTIVIVGDHPRMDNHLVENVEYDDRTLYNCFINTIFEDKEEIRTQNRQTSMLDMFPTVLASLGYKIEGDKLGLGTNLFSDERTLVEELGLEVLNKEFIKRSTYYVERFTPEMAYLVADEKVSIKTIYLCGEEYNAQEYVLEGLAEPERKFCYIEGKKMTVRIPLEVGVDNVRIKIHIVGMVRDEYYSIVQNSEELCNGVVREAGILEFDAEVIDGICEFSVLVPHVESPYLYGMSDDTRPISLKLSHITVNYCED